MCALIAPQVVGSTAVASSQRLATTTELRRMIAPSVLTSQLPDEFNWETANNPRSTRPPSRSSRVAMRICPVDQSAMRVALALSGAGDRKLEEPPSKLSTLATTGCEGT